MTATGERDALQFQGTACDVCGEVRPRATIDTNHWCEDCRPRMLKRLRVWRHATALVVALPIAAWVFIHPTFGRQPLMLWSLFVIAAYYLGFRFGREVMKVYTRLRRGA